MTTQRLSIIKNIGLLTGGALMTAALVGCATPTPYQPASSSSRSATGYSNQQITADRFRVSFSGNSLTSRETVEDYLLYRAAELTREQGYDGFILMQRDTERRVNTRVDRFGPSPYSYWGPSWRYYRGGRGWSYWDPYFADPFWDRSVDVRTVQRYEAFAEIKMFRGTRPNDDKAFDAQDVLRTLGSRIERPQT
ncbi:hypothetical protein AB1K62_03970 [Parasphingorhabdus sp. JC815]|uniref:CC0125/CC1285 family lipoprotein n=1 Tax=Parasphingorhabdus sp. JC815 TaxID=3232140 RepID=UPI003457F6A7